MRHTSHRYGPHALQRVGVWEPVSRRDEAGPWIVYIHGGAWRDPRNTLYDFEPTINILRNDAVRGFASIDYRLSRHPDFPQDPAVTPEAELRTALHPQHMNDVRAALKMLLSDDNAIINAEDGYLLVGHSAGATLALQVLMSNDERNIIIPPPRAVVAIAGIYDLIGLNRRFNDQYSAFISGAFGPDQQVWRDASPLHLLAGWRPQENLALTLAQSPQDELIDVTELRNMAGQLKEAGIENVCIVPDLAGDHDAPWREGQQVADLVRRTLTDR
ncbi:hypothetical protein CDD80_6377 [Ophiocordyceps camponoti-rufipedis]|uniref:Kynurenine formamidase n=1 Tax=Ophiocordyceps camponoti-rufipedis TaxID=2004952 RepID=A0A2C5YMB3_9HYPO|nr:hypothetical protein CDD80_6377 [Ophiocordyceps camponoti-rufipedis]